MALPKIDTPVYDLTLPLSKKKVKFRPFNVKEQRNLLMAMESEDTKEIQDAVENILNNCNLTENIAIGNLPIIDVEYYFINLRAKSVGEIVESKYRCNNEVDGKLCGNIMDADVDLTKINVNVNKDVNRDIKLDNKLTIRMKYPEFSFVRESLEYDNINDLTFNMMAECVECIYDGEQYYYSNEVPREEIVEFLESLSKEQFDNIEDFFNNIPKIEQTIDMTCKKCGFQHHLTVEGLENFFG
jgi:hypothetical protein